ncbi:DUF2252 domain-containing protein [Crocosphaera sp. XPORK-15E]|uniref:DUF2252 domain-containing protein n=1 Tax=Crocosphaera sp. XPORK-15E TaxID=3110247 RepID=UPI002B1EB37A|nr:DUF2252 family protein [Crocosphaera sp. XPORK-15E]MEA5532780.1 DUF2252 family protein [Crocosphaera sp. XPORK-15E]
MKQLIASLWKFSCVFILISLINFCIFSASVLAESGNNSEQTNQVVKAIKAANSQLSDKIKTEKYCSLACELFTFYRGTNYLYWTDFSQDSRLKQFGNDKTKTWISADLHLNNFGAYNNDEGEIVFDLNDFDESVVADYQYDIWRMATSIVLGVSNNDPTSLTTEKRKDVEDAIDKFTESYLDTLASYLGNDQENSTYFTAKNTAGKVKDLLQEAEDMSRQDLLKKWTEKDNNKPRFKSPKEIKHKLETASKDEKKAIKSQFFAYGNTLSGKLKYDENTFQIKDIAPRLKAGLGSLGTPRYYVLIEGDSDSLKDDRILDVKRQSKPTAYQVFSQAEKATYDQLFKNDAQRHEIAYSALTKHTDDYLGWMYLTDPKGNFTGYYSVREVSPNKSDFEDIDFNLAEANKQDLLEVAQQWGQILATDHARADQDFDAKYVPYSLEKQVTEITDGKHQEFRYLVKEIAFDYANQVQADYDSFVDNLKPENCPKCE